MPHTDEEAQYNLPDRESMENRLYEPAAADRMDKLATEADVERFLVDYPDAVYLTFTEDRLHAVRWTHGVPEHWLKDPGNHLNTFSGKACPGEFFVFQLAVLATRENLQNINVRFGDLASDTEPSLPECAFRSISLGGIGPDGEPFQKHMTAPKGKLQPLWIGVDVPVDAKGGYTGILEVHADDALPAPVRVVLTVEGEPLPDHGTDDAWRLSRLRWLDSTAGHGDTPIAPFEPVKREGQHLHILGRQLQLGANGLPEQAISYFSSSNTRIEQDGRPILAGPFRFEAETHQGIGIYDADNMGFLQENLGAVDWRATGTCGNLTVSLDGHLEFDGYVRYRLLVEASTDISLKDIRLVIPFHTEGARYLMGLGHKGGLRPEQVGWTWDVTRHQDTVWIGDINAGMQIRWKDADYARPLVNIYYRFRPLKLPVSWGNNGKGGVTLASDKDSTTRLTAHSGERRMRKGDTLSFDFDLYLTPFKPLDTEGQWKYRYIHPPYEEDDRHFQDLSLVEQKGASIVNMHHDRALNPFINYPYNEFSFSGLIDCVRRAHAHNLMMKVYYTTREITNNMRELFAFNSLDGEIICPTDVHPVTTVINRDGPHPWLIEHLGDRGYIPAWRTTLKGRYEGMLDLAVITTPDTRWNNFYLEGLKRLVDRADIDGLYIDDTALDRRSLQRTRRILDANNPTSQIDFHSWNHFNDMAAYASCANLYMEIFPYVNRIWFGEGFDYDSDPDYWLVEIAGIPFGLMSEMLQGGGNPWRGMVYGMTQRLDWCGDPRPIWEAMDTFGIQGSHMIGYWDPDCPVSTDKKDVPVTAYCKEGKALIAMASWSEKPEEVTLRIDWKKIGIDRDNARLEAPEIKDFQGEAVFKLSDTIPVAPGKGWLMVVEG